MDSTFNIDLPSQERKAYQTLVREIHRRELKKGDKLPPQEQLRQEVGYSHATLSKAMEHLVNDGVLERRKSKGTHIVNLDAIRMNAWTVAVLLNWEHEAPSPYYLCLTHLLQQELSRHGFQIRLYYRRDQHEDRDRLQDHPQLIEDIESERIQGILSASSMAEEDLKWLDANEVPIVFGTSWEASQHGCTIDTGSFATAAIEHFVQRGLKHLAIVGPKPQADYLRFFAEAQSCSESMKGLELSFIQTSSPGLKGGSEAAQRLMDLKDEHAPHALIVADDHLALGLSHQMLKHERSMDMAVLTHDQCPVLFPYPIWSFGVDDRNFSQQTVQILKHSLIDPNHGKTQRWLGPRSCNEQAQTYPHSLS